MSATTDALPAARPRRRRWRRAVLNGLCGLLLAAGAIFPVAYMLLTSLKPDAILMEQPPRFLFLPTLANYTKLLLEDDFARYYWNSIVVAGSSTLIAVALGSMMAFVFVRGELRHGKKLLFLILLPKSFPPITTIIPLFIAVRFLGMMDQVVTLIIFEAAVRLPLVVWVMRGFLRSVPPELIEAATLDGCSLPGAFFRIVLPLAAPGMGAVGIICFIDTWNAFLVPLVLTNFRAITAPVALMSYAETEEQLVWGIIAAGGFLTILPILLFALLLHRFLLSGLTAGAIK
ncbi:carbohydrate ABC transporter permease [Muricoccus radiodurans]|uniref:carbohydrate ABC transporter permease n=1 Tax=Muricoccus radiodurans TaxID=2231721 RepID=UPI003CEA78B9